MGLKETAFLFWVLLLFASCAVTRQKVDHASPPDSFNITVTDEKLTDAAIQWLATSADKNPQVYEERRRDFEKALTEYFSTHEFSDALTLHLQREGMTFVFPIKFVTSDSMQKSGLARADRRETSQIPDFDAQVTLVLDRKTWDAPPNAFSELPAVVWFHIAETLFGISPDGKRIPILASHVESDSTGRIWEIRLRSGVRFSDGSEVTAEDVRLSWRSNFRADRQSGGASHWLWRDILGVEEFVAGKATTIRGLQVVDERTLKIFLKEPRPHFLEHLTQPCFTVTKSSGENDVVIGTGPFRIADVKSQNTTSTIICSRNQYYHGGRPSLKEVRFLFQNGSIIDTLMDEEGAGAIVKQKKNIDYFRKLQTVSTIAFPVQPIYFLALNPLVEPLTDVALRRYIATEVLSRSEIENIVTESEGEAAPTFFPDEETRVASTTRDSIRRVTRALGIAFRARDDVARQIAERLHARFDQLNMPSRAPTPLSDDDFESLRQSGKYDILVDAFAQAFATPLYDLLQLLKTGYGVDAAIMEELETALIEGSSNTPRRVQKKLIEQAVFHPLIRIRYYAVLPAELQGTNLLNAYYLDFSKAWMPENRHAKKN